jgi:signal transduction histidine kinase/ligand-binding sensor domain-containing protein/DNA-binding NarL/FixJ family response regulator
VFRKTDTSILPHNYITALGEDHHNNIWIGTSQGASLYNSLTGNISRGFFEPSGAKQKQPISFYINDLKTDAAGNLFLGVDGGGLLVVQHGSNVAIQTVCPGTAKGNSKYEVSNIVIDRQQRVWLFVRKLGLCTYDRKTKTIQVVYRNNANVISMEGDDQENIWIGSSTGLFKYNIPGHSLNEVALKLTSKVINSLKFDRQRKLWIGTEVGINVLEPATGKLDYILSNENKSKNKLAGNNVNCILEDNENRKWIGITKGGVDIIDPQANGFRTIAHDPLNPNSLANDFVSAFYEDEEQNLWIGTDNGKISIWNRKQNTFKNYRQIPGSNDSASNYEIPAFLKDKMGDLWIASFGSGIYKLNRFTKRLEHYKCINYQKGEENVNAWLLYEDREGNLWATTFRWGLLFLLNRQKNRFEPFCQDYIDIFSMFEDHTGTLWAGTSFGFSRINKQSKSFNYYETGKPVRAVLEDKKGRLWLGTEGNGLLLFDKLSTTITRSFTEQDGLCNNAVLNIQEDGDGQLWLSTFHGLSKFDPEKKTFRNYYQEDGLQSNQFSYNAARRLRSGEMVFGGIKGFNIFNPAGLKKRNYFPPVLITGLRINNEQVVEGSKYVTSIHEDKIGSLKIPFSEAVLSVDFAALEFSAPGKILYAYYLEGWDKGWNNNGAIRTANYTRLSEGNYTLHIRATNAEQIWNPREVSLRIVVLPPWYRSWWAYACYLLLLVCAIVTYQRYRAHQTKLVFEIKLARANAAKERAERETERLINDKEKEINEKRLTFFTSISHEFRTPIGLIINPIKDLLRDPDTSKKGQAELKLIYRNGRRLLSLVDQLLLFRKAEAGADRLRIVKLDLCALCKEVFLAFEQQARALNIQYEFTCTPEAIDMYADREKLEIVFYNLISNALKYTTRDGSILVEVSEGLNTARVLVKDTGCGIPGDVGDKLFERFYQVRKMDTPVRSGFGIGLFLVKHFVESLKGRIWYESREGIGTTFTVELLKGRNHFDDELIFDDTTNEPTLIKDFIEEVTTMEETAGDKTGKPEWNALLSERRSMLIVDDDAQINEYLVQLFAAEFTVYHTDNAIEGLKLAGQHVPDIIISDVNMDGMNGIALCTAIKEDASLSHIPIILLTGNETQETRLEGLEGGADDYIIKPFDNELLMARVKNILKSRTTLQKYFFNEVTLGKTSYHVAPEYKRFLDNCIAVVEANLENPGFGIKMMASELSMGQSNLYKKVKSISGQSPSSFIRCLRLRKVAQLLIETDYNINEAALTAGFNDMKYFREQFSRLFGMKPSDYVKTYRKGTPS